MFLSLSIFTIHQVVNFFIIFDLKKDTKNTNYLLILIH